MTSNLFSDGVKVELAKMLERREQRVLTYYNYWQKEPTATIISLKLNIPGPIKNNTQIKACFERLLKPFWAAIEAKELTYKVVFSELELLTGPEIIIAGGDLALTWKELALSIETRKTSSRLLDVDVLTKQKTLTRKDLNLPPRRCYLCDAEAKVCARSRRHSIEEMQAWIDNALRKDGLI